MKLFGNFHRHRKRRKLIERNFDGVDRPRLSAGSIPPGRDTRSQVAAIKLSWQTAES